MILLSFSLVIASFYRFGRNKRDTRHKPERLLFHPNSSICCKPLLVLLGNSNHILCENNLYCMCRSPHQEVSDIQTQIKTK